MKLTKLLFELDLEYGKRLFADPSDTPFVEPEFMDPNEPNTDQEKKILKALQAYFKFPGNDIDITLLNKLYDLRDKFPKLLKPTTDVGYRGATMRLDQIMKVKWKKYSYGYYAEGLTKVSTQRSGFISISSNEAEAKFFAGQGQNLDKIDRIPVVYEIPINKNRVLFNTEYSNGLSRFSEDEMLLLTDNNTFMVDGITTYDSYLRNFRLIPEPGDPEYDLYLATQHIISGDDPK
jgi:hypothetical protein